MQEPRIPPPEKVSHLKPRKKKPLKQVASAIQKKGKINSGKQTLHPSRKAKNGSKRNLTTDASPPIQQTDASTPDSLPDASLSSSEYRALRHKYLLLEEESFSLDEEQSKVGGEVKTLEDEKSALLDQLVVLEGLIDPSELKPQGRL